ncbi:MAG: hypothetical protein J3Q66DRAFT_441581 [Benniella sp.]|nr:MAG: hypothetical protein J3Q66DRAFT_441581 [Benniella sp.]
MMSDIISTDAKEWIDMDPLPGSLTPWLCESSLTDLRIRISGIPRPDVIRNDRGKKRQHAVEETYPGEGQMTQHRVYERLSRFVNLDTTPFNGDDDRSKRGSIDGGALAQDT